MFRRNNYLVRQTRSRLRVPWSCLRSINCSTLEKSSLETRAPRQWKTGQWGLRAMPEEWTVSRSGQSQEFFGVLWCRETVASMQMGRKNPWGDNGKDQESRKKVGDHFWKKSIGLILSIKLYQVVMFTWQHWVDLQVRLWYLIYLFHQIESRFTLACSGLS